MCADFSIPCRRIYAVGGCGGAIVLQHLAEQRPDLCAGGVIWGGNSFIRSRGAHGSFLAFELPITQTGGSQQEDLVEYLCDRGCTIWAIQGAAPWNLVGDPDGWFWHNMYDSDSSMLLAGVWLTSIAARRSVAGDSLTAGWAFAANRDPRNPRLVRCDQPDWRESLGDESRPILLPDLATARAWANTPRHDVPLAVPAGFPMEPITISHPAIGTATACGLIDLPGPAATPKGIVWVVWGTALPGSNKTTDVAIAKQQGFARGFLADRGWAAVEWVGGLATWPLVRSQVDALIGKKAADLPQVVMLLHPTAAEAQAVIAMTGIWASVVVIDGDEHPKDLAPALTELTDHWPSQVVVTRQAMTVADEDLRTIVQNTSSDNPWPAVVRATPGIYRNHLAAHQAGMVQAEQFLTEAVRQVERPADAVPVTPDAKPATPAGGF